ncbi:GNAT family N-acetyltransferase [Ferroacidibacillus organovorans]|uniref:Acetyltransferase n=1 Tax=Ferroacidibacillus organovorans TaxID=1765683 RepID=A0A117SY12_9BACL|nr:GNAT family N-acetyltransferase [Ferroacidibacillus organovorans]KUO96350.1 acetyltransferase [Ferroacidibacillus organovorans]
MSEENGIFYELSIRPLSEDENPPIDLLLLADPSLSLISKYLRRGACYVAEIENRVAGVYVLLETRPETIELVNVAVCEHLQGQGIGKRLILHAIETARKDGFRTIEVGTGNSSVFQLYLYQKCGFRVVGVDTDYFIRHYDETIFENGIQCRDMIRMMQDL